VAPGFAFCSDSFFKHCSFQRHRQSNIKLAPRRLRVTNSGSLDLSSMISLRRYQTSARIFAPRIAKSFSSTEQRRIAATMEWKRLAPDSQSTCWEQLELRTFRIRYAAVHIIRGNIMGAKANIPYDASAESISTISADAAA
jgi:hypothetical protein